MGFDAIPAQVDGGRGAAFVATSAAWSYLRGAESDGFGAALSAQAVTYDPRARAPALSLALSARHASPLGPATLLRGSLTVEREESWSRRRQSVLWRERIEHALGPARLFAQIDMRAAALNERNIFALGGFLPREETLAQPSLLVGGAWRGAIGAVGAGEVGVSLMLARPRWFNGADYLGLRRDNDRAQINLFASAALGRAQIEGSASYFLSRFPDRDFDDVRRMLYTAKASVPLGGLTLEIASARQVEDTTLPFSVINMTTSHEAKLTAATGERSRAAVVVRRKTDDYIGLGARATADSIGLEVAHDIDARTTAIAALAWRRSRETGAAPIDAALVQIGLQRRIDVAGAGKLAASRSSEAAPVKRPRRRGIRRGRRLPRRERFTSSAELRGRAPRP